MIGEDGFRAADRAMSPTPWQEIIHGDTHEFRASVVSWLEREGHEKRATAVALCGCNDKVTNGRDGRRVRPMRCGHALCPRCSRYRGYKYVRRVMDHLRTYEHGTLMHVVLTQQVYRDELLAATAARFERRWRVWWAKAMRLGKVTSALRTVHISWSRAGGWHYHAHVIVECGKELELAQRTWDRLLAGWADVRHLDGDTKVHQDRMRVISGPGGPLVELDDGASDFWQESQIPAVQCVQYAARDVCQGVGSWNLAACGERVGEIIGDVRHAKLRRLYGRWRRKVESAEVVESQAPVVEAEPEWDAEHETSQTVDGVLYAAGRGEPEAEELALWLLTTCGNRSAMGERLKRVLARFVGERRCVVAA